MMINFLWLAASTLALLCGSVFLRAEGPDDQYVRIYNLIQQAEGLEEAGRSELARQKYSEAQTELNRVQKAYPGWNEQVIRFRLSYVTEKLGLAKPEEKPPRREPAAKSPLDSAEPADRINSLLEQIRQLTADKELLQAKLKEALSAQPASVDPRELAWAEDKIKSLRKEVEVLTVSLKKAEARANKPIDPAAIDRTKQELAAANQKLNEPVTKSGTLEKELAHARRAAQTNADLVSVLQIALGRALAEKDARATDKRKAETTPDSAPAAQRGQIEQLAEQSAVLRARLEALDARAIPYSPDELALFKTSDSIAANTASTSGKQSSGDSSAGTTLLVGEANRALAARRYDEAEKKYAQAMRLDQTNVHIRANLAAAQIGQNRLAEGEANLKRALASDPQNAVSLSLLGGIKARQHKYDEALDLLSQSAQLDAQNPDTFQYLGVTLAGKGLRRPAESAFRRVIQLEPENAEAHHSLAIVYATQQPPALELARLHYQKGLAGGHPKDSKLEQLLSANNPAAVGGANALNR
jgi:Tfp pilus assembly protein PilF